MEQTDGKTRLDSVWALKLKGFYRLVGPLVSRSARKKSEALVGNIKRMIE